MTIKQEEILKAAAELFAKESYHATSTNKVAKVAGVSEGLIFRHFKNKEGLLQTILHQGEQRFYQLYTVMLQEIHPAERIRKFIEIPFSVPETEYDFWKLQFTIKWEIGYDSSKKMEPIKQALTTAFEQLSYQQPALESLFLIHYMDGFISALAKEGIPNKQDIKLFLLKKYNL
jgi:AcrR family transcriptional regulator